MRKLTLAVVLCAGVLSSVLTGCNQGQSSNFSSLPRAQQENSMKADPAKMAEFAKQYAKQGPPQPQAKPPVTH